MVEKGLTIAKAATTLWTYSLQVMLHVKSTQNTSLARATTARAVVAWVLTDPEQMIPPFSHQEIAKVEYGRANRAPQPCSSAHTISNVVAQTRARIHDLKRNAGNSDSG